MHIYLTCKCIAPCWLLCLEFQHCNSQLLYTFSCCGPAGFACCVYRPTESPLGLKGSGAYTVHSQRCILDAPLGFIHPVCSCFTCFVSASRFQERSIFHHGDRLNEDDKFMLLYTLAVNPEPIILQSFPSGEGWPFPAYIGACGRIIAVENSGKTLREYFHSSWMTRVCEPVVFQSAVFYLEGHCEYSY